MIICLRAFYSFFQCLAARLNTMVIREHCGGNMMQDPVIVPGQALCITFVDESECNVDCGDIDIHSSSDDKILNVNSWSGYSCSAGSKQHKSRSCKPMRAALAQSHLLLAFVFCFIRTARAGELETMGQVLPSACTEWFDQNDCLNKNEWGEEWEELNSRCCSAFTGTVLHCQKMYSDHPPHNQFNALACLPNQNVPPGQTGMLQTDASGNATFVKVPCSSTAAFEDKERLSSDIAFPYCTKIRSTCAGVGLVKLCSGGPSADDLCTCVAGYKPDAEHCFAGFTNNDACVCEVMACDHGLCAVRTPAASQQGLCTDRFTVQFNYTACPKTSSSIPSSVASLTHSSSTVSLADVTTPPKKLDDNTTPLAGIPVSKAPDGMGIGYKVSLGLCISVYLMVLLSF